MLASESSDAINSWTMELDLDKISFTDGASETLFSQVTIYRPEIST
jgi:hypothetical protein